MKILKDAFSGIFLLIICSGGCIKWVEHNYRIEIRNNANDTIQFYANYTYPDTVIITEKPRMIMAYPKSFGFWDSKKKFESLLPSDTISIFILSKDTVNQYNWSVIKSDYKILKRYDLSIGDLKKLGWEVSYPPTESMKDIKQFPPY